MDALWESKEHDSTPPSRAKQQRRQSHDLQAQPLEEAHSLPARACRTARQQHLERALKTSIHHREHSHFYKTEDSERVGKIFMSLLHTSQLCDANPFEDLTSLQQNEDLASAAPENRPPLELSASPGSNHPRSPK